MAGRTIIRNSKARKIGLDVEWRWLEDFQIFLGGKEKAMTS
jgi:hypothetical protein